MWIALTLTRLARSPSDRACASIAASSASSPLTAIKSCKSCECALQLLSEIRCSASGPDVYAYATAISVCGKDSEWEAALLLLDDMVADGLAPDPACFNAALSACGRSGRSSQALQLLDRMRASGSPPMRAQKLAVARRCVSSGDLVNALALMDEIAQESEERAWGDLRVEIDACFRLLPHDEPTFALADRIVSRTREALATHRVRQSLTSAEFDWLWSVYSRAQLTIVRAVVSDKMGSLLDLEATNRLLGALSQAASSGQPPCFKDAGALAGYTTFHLINRASKVGDLLRLREPSWLGLAAEQALARPVLSLGGGPAYDLAGLALLRGFHKMCSQGEAPLASESYIARKQDTSICVHVLDFEPAWEGAAATVTAAARSTLDSDYVMQFGPCDVTLPLAHPRNQCVREVLPRASLLIASYVIAENARTLSASKFGFFEEVMEHAPPGALLLLTETTHRQFPEAVSAVARGVERSSRRAEAETDASTCTLEVAFPYIKGRGGSQCVMFKRPRRELHVVHESAKEQRCSTTGNEEPHAAVQRAIARYAKADRAHRTSRREHSAQGSPRRRTGTTFDGSATL